ncbi:MAG: hypothetical protein EBT99_12200 [Betaproteobacteria bacterium]|nr:hypothetical protein [Betaproteobacteria bacterium]
MCLIVIIDCNAFNDYNQVFFSNRSAAMASITIRNLDDHIKQRLRVRAAEHGRSMRTRVAASARADLKLPTREPMREPPQIGRQ